MKKKYLIYLLTFLMAFSPAAVFADINDGGDAGNPGTEAVEPEAEAPADDTALMPAEEETVQEDAALDGETHPDGWDENKTHYYKDNVALTGLFKVKMDNEKEAVALFYADSDGVVSQRVGPVKVEGIEKGKYYSFNGRAFDYDSDLESPVTYFQTYNSDYKCYCMDEVTGIKTYEGSKKCYLTDKGIVQTDAGVLSLDGSKYYVQDGGEIKTTAGWVTDADGTKYYLPANTAAEGKLWITQGFFGADGKTWYAANGGAVRTSGGLFPYNGSQYFSYNDGSVNTAAGFITTGGKKYLCAAGGAIRATAGVVDYGGNKYVALADGSICTAVGFVNAGGKRYYVSNSDGVLAVNKSFKSGSKTYHALADGTIGVGVHKWGKYYYYADSSGAIRTKKGVVSWNGNKYYVKKGGKITTNKKVKYKGKTYIAGSDGAFAKGIFTWKKNLYYADKKGKLRTKAGVFTYNGDRYCSKKGGKLYRNKLFTMKGKKYLAQSDGKLQAGYLSWKGKLYLTNAKCVIYTKAGMYAYGNKQYYVKKGGPLAVNQFVESKNNHYYCGSDGAVVKKPFTYNGVTITPNPQTGVISDEEYWKAFPNEAPQPAGN